MRYKWGVMEGDCLCGWRLISDKTSLFTSCKEVPSGTSFFVKIRSCQRFLAAPDFNQCDQKPGKASRAITMSSIMVIDLKNKYLFLP